MNTTIIKSALIFAAGAATGSAASLLLLKKKYEQFAQEQIDSVKEVYSKREKEVSDITDEVYEGVQLEFTEVDADNNQEQDEYLKTINKFGYGISGITDKKEEEPEKMDEPYVIPPEEFGEFEDYEHISLTYYADGVLTDDQNELVDDVDDVVGLDSLNTFGDYEPDSVHVRNDKLMCDYEILKDPRNYSDVIKKPHQMEEE